MKVFVDLGKDYKAQNGDMLVYENNEWKLKQHSIVFKNEQKLIEKLALRVAELEDEIKTYTSETNKKVNTLAKSIDTLLGD